LNEGQFDITYIKPKSSRKSFFEPGAAKDYFTPNTPDSEGTEWAPKPWLNSDYVPPSIPLGGRLEPDYKKHKVNMYDVTRELRKRSDRLNVDKKFPDIDNIKIPDSVFKEKERSPYLIRYGNPDAIDIMPEERRDMISSIKIEDHPLAKPNKDMISSIKREDHPLANLNNDLNLLRDKTVGQSRNTFDYNEIKNKLSRMSKNI
jgi:hypothetical protein